MRKILFNITILLLLTSVVFICYNVFMSFRFQYVIQNDRQNKIFSFTSNKTLSIPSIPNIGVTTIPIDAYRANYHFAEGKIREANILLDKARNANPYLYYAEFTKARYYMYAKNYDSAYVYAKKAFYGWPKYIEHYKLFNETLIQRKDTLQILQAYDSINKLFYDRSEYQSNFIESLKNAKLRYLITDYSDLLPVKKKSLIGKWQQVYEFESGEVLRLKNIVEINESSFKNGNSIYNYNILHDSLILRFQTTNSIVAKYGINFTANEKILVLKNVPVYINMDSISYQNQFFKKIIE